MKLDKYTCFWCEKQFSKRTLTRDHVIPRGVGGKKGHENIVKACYQCNNDRGKIVSIYTNLRMLSKRKEINRWKAITKAFERLPYWLELQAKWAKIELAKLGYSPSAKIKLEVIDGRTKKIAVMKDQAKEWNGSKSSKNAPNFVVIESDGTKHTWNCNLMEAIRRADILIPENAREIK